MVKLTLIDQIRDKEMQDNDLVRKVQKIMNVDLGENFMITQDEVLVMKGMICVHNVNDLRKAIMK